MQMDLLSSGIQTRELRRYSDLYLIPTFPFSL